MNQLEQIKKEARVTWGLKIGRKSNQFDQEKVLFEIIDLAHQAGKEAERQRIVDEFTKLKEKSKTVRDQLYLDGVIVVITDGDTEKYIKA